MKEIIRKMNLSIITCILVLILNVTTTFAWAGLQNYSNVENFEMSLESSEKYELKVSLDGINFYNEIDELEFQKTVLVNMGVLSSIEEDANKIKQTFSKIILTPVTTKRIGNDLGTFVSIDDIRKKDFHYDSVIESDHVKKSYFNFDIYVAIDYVGGESDESYINEYQDIYISDVSNLLIGNNKTYKLNSNYVLENYFNDLTLKTVKVDTSSAARMSFTKYQVMEKGKPVDTNVVDTIIYQGGTQTPTLNDDVYSFGGFMNHKDNLAYLEFNDLHDDEPISLDVFNEFYNNRINPKTGLEDAISSEQLEIQRIKLIDENDKFNTKSMIKVNVKMWLEGFDADCFEAIATLPVGFDLVLANYNLH